MSDVTKVTSGGIVEANSYKKKDYSTSPTPSTYSEKVPPFPRILGTVSWIGALSCYHDVMHDFLNMGQEQIGAPSKMAINES